MGSATGDGSAAAIRGDPKQKNKSPSNQEAGLDASPHTRLPGGQGEEFFLDILSHRMSVMGILRQGPKAVRRPGNPERRRDVQVNVSSTLNSSFGVANDGD